MRTPDLFSVLNRGAWWSEYRPQHNRSAPATHGHGTNAEGVRFMRTRAFRTTALALAGGLAATAVAAGAPAHAAAGDYTAFVFNTSSASEPTIYNFINS